MKHGSAWIAHALAIGCIASLAASVRLPGWSNWSRFTFPLFVAVTVFVGWFLAWRRPRTALGWMVLAIPVLFSVATMLNLLGQALVPTRPTAAAWLLLFGGGNSVDRAAAWVPPVGLLLSQLPLRYPTGSLPSGRWRWFFWYTVTALVVATLFGAAGPDIGYGVASPLHFEWGDAEPILVFVIFGLGLAVSFVGSVASLFVRYRDAGAVERAQLRWMFWAVAVAVGLLLQAWIVGLLVPADGPYGWLRTGAAILSGLGYCAIPISILIAVMRFGLYGIDRIISRTVSYTLVVIVVMALYAGIVVGITAVIPGLPSIGVALATLAAAGVFLPLLRRVQRWVDRRFDRAAYDAQRVVEAFGQRLRTAADPYAASADLAVAVDAALQPATLGVWTRSTT